MSNENVIFIMVKKYQQIMQDLRMKIAERYKSRECITSYNIMNEPYNGRKKISFHQEFYPKFCNERVF
ncbi:MAG: hypothetical protein L6V93_06725 [Clostridiales bacterium]|nr:MAG: hypothetical protein L6V93_06725 [Clostridiales bacterium]